MDGCEKRHVSWQNDEVNLILATSQTQHLICNKKEILNMFLLTSTLVLELSLQKHALYLTFYYVSPVAIIC